jgi:hypothetical protein
MGGALGPPNGHLLFLFSHQACHARARRSEPPVPCACLDDWTRPHLRAGLSARLAWLRLALSCATARCLPLPASVLAAKAARAARGRGAALPRSPRRAHCKIGQAADTRAYGALPGLGRISPIRPQMHPCGPGQLHASAAWLLWPGPWSACPACRPHAEPPVSAHIPAHTTRGSDRQVPCRRGRFRRLAAPVLRFVAEKCLTASAFPPAPTCCFEAPHRILPFPPSELRMECAAELCLAAR